MAELEKMTYKKPEPYVPMVLHPDFKHPTIDIEGLEEMTGEKLTDYLKECQSKARSLHDHLEYLKSVDPAFSRIIPIEGQKSGRIKPHIEKYLKLKRNKGARAAKRLCLTGHTLNKLLRNPEKSKLSFS